MDKAETLNYFIERGVPFSIFKDDHYVFIVAIDNFRTMPGSPSLYDNTCDIYWFELFDYINISMKSYLSLGAEISW